MPRSAKTLSALNSAPGSLLSVKTTDVLSGAAQRHAIAADREEARDVVLEILDARLQRLEAEQTAGAAGRNRRRVAAPLVADHLGAAGGVVGCDRLDVLQRPQESRALGQRLRMRQHPPHVLESHARKRQQVVHHRHLHLADDRQVGFDEQVVVAVNRPADGVLDRHDAERHTIVVHRFEDVLERGKGRGSASGSSRSTAASLNAPGSP